MDRKKILWILPNYNFYNAQRINLLCDFFEITVIAGRINKKLGFKNNITSKAKVFYAKKGKGGFGFSVYTFRLVLKNLFDKDFVYIAVEKKNIILFLFLLIYRIFVNKKFKCFSYNHFMLKSKNSKFKKINYYITKLFYWKLDKVIFYTKKTFDLAIKENMINPKKSFWANNTIDTIEVSKHYTFELPPINEITIVFIGRLIPSKRVDVLIDFFNQISEKSYNSYILEIIGNGPDSYLVENAMKDNSKIIWHGALVDEIKISPIMKRASLVFVPGASGLSINHAFAYGRPYATLKLNRHGPEISYLKHEENGFIIDDDLSIIKSFLNDRKKVEAFCYNALNSAKNLSVLKWTKQIKTALNV